MICRTELKPLICSATFSKKMPSITVAKLSAKGPAVHRANSCRDGADSAWVIEPKSFAHYLRNYPDCERSSNSWHGESERYSRGICVFLLSLEGYLYQPFIGVEIYCFFFGQMKRLYALSALGQLSSVRFQILSDLGTNGC